MHCAINLFITRLLGRLFISVSGTVWLQLCVLFTYVKYSDNVRGMCANKNTLQDVRI